MPHYVTARLAPWSNKHALGPTGKFSVARLKAAIKNGATPEFVDVVYDKPFTIAEARAMGAVAISLRYNHDRSVAHIPVGVK